VSEAPHKSQIFFCPSLFVGIRRTKSCFEQDYERWTLLADEELDGGRRMLRVSDCSLMDGKGELDRFQG
jgi:hypothetical protein